MNERMLLALDPSKTATGWVIYDSEKDRVIGTGCFKASMEKDKKKEFSRKTEIYKREQLSFVEFLTKLKVRYGIEKVITEYPHGSQSATASWALSMVNSTIQTFTQLVLGVPAVTYLESDCKRANFDTNKVSKEETMEAMMEKYCPKGYKPHTHHGRITKTQNEDICDALLVLNTYLKE